MKATLIAAAFLIPTLVLANDPTTKDTYGQKTKDSQQQTQVETQTPTQVLTDIHMLSQTGIEQATVAQSNAGNERLKSFAEKQVKDFQKLDKSVLDLAKERKITLTSMDTGSEPPAKTTKEVPGEAVSSTGTGTGTTGSTGTDIKSGATGSGTTGSSGSTTQMGTANDARTGTATEEREITSPPPTTDDARMGSTTGSAKPTEAMDKEQQDSRWQRLRTLKGAEFDNEYLSMVTENARQNVSTLESARIKGDRKLDKLIDSAVKTFKDHQKQVEKLQRDIRAS